jgi:hypothetical protein
VLSTIFRILILATALLPLSIPAAAAEPTAAERVTTLKAQLAASEKALHGYQWTETTTVTINGYEQSRSARNCSFAPDGTLRTEPVQQTSVKPLMNRRNAPKAKDPANEDLARKAERLIHQYIPLNPNGLDAAVRSGKLTYTVTDPGRRGRLIIRNFLMKGDQVTLDLELPGGRPLWLNIASYLDTVRDPVAMTVQFGTLGNNITFIRENILEATTDRALRVVVSNSGHKPVTE